MARKYLLAAFVVIAVAGVALALVPRARANGASPTSGPPTVRVARGAFVRSLRLTGIIESVRYHNVIAPRLVGVTGPNTLIITKIARGGTQIGPGDLLVEFDRQTQLKAAFDRRAQYLDLEEQIRKKRAEQEQAKAKDDAELAVAVNAVETARLEIRKNELLPKILAEKNVLQVEQADAKVKQLRETFDLKRRAEASELRILEIQRDRARTSMEQAEQNASRMVVKSPLPGVVVLRTSWRGNQMVEIQEGEEARPGMPIMLVVDPSAMLVRVKVNQADLHVLRVGQPARISLDAYPGLEFSGRVEQVAPVGTTSRLTDRVRNFVAIVSIQGSHPKLMPDLSAAVDVELERKDNVIVLPRDAIVSENQSTSVRVLNGERAVPRRVTLGAMNDHEVVVTSGLESGVTVQRHVAR
jgi:HlyD family secretion protein